MFAASTTALGLLSLGYSDLNPIRMFGAFSAVGVVLGSLTHFLVLPAAFAVWTPGRSSRRSHAGGAVQDGPSHLALWPKLGSWVTTHPQIVLTVFLAAALWGCWDYRESARRFR